MPKELRFGDKARQEMIAGVNALAKTVQATQGSRGRHVVLEKAYVAPTVTKDIGSFNSKYCGRFLAPPLTEQPRDNSIVAAPK